MLKFTQEPFDCYASPPRVGIGDAFNVEVPEGAGTLHSRWDSAADELFDELMNLSDEEDQFLQYRWRGTDRVTIDVRVWEAQRPATLVLTHPRLVKFLHDGLRQIFGGDLVIYVLGERVRARSVKHATPMRDWLGPFSIDTGYCLDYPADPAP